MSSVADVGSVWSRAVSLEGEMARGLDEFQVNYGFVSGYSMKFQGCHHISQWNGEAASDEDGARVITKRLARFRLCPSGNCDGGRANGCTSKYGDYVADLNTFVHYYLTSLKEEMAGKCSQHYEQCKKECNGDDDGCLYHCYTNAGLTGCMDDDDSAALDPLDFAYCAPFDSFHTDDNATSYLGPYCSEQGDAVYMGLFADSACATFSSCDSDCFSSAMGYQLPYNTSTLLPDNCVSCSQNYLATYGNNNNNNGGVRDTCEAIYSVSGKCETKMQVDYPNESACTYIEGIKIIKEDGGIRTMSVRKSKVAAVGIGLFTSLAVLLAAYVYYLRTKLGRAKINLYHNTGAVLA